MTLAPTAQERQHMAFHWIGKSTDGNTITLNRLDSALFSTQLKQKNKSASEDDMRVGAVIDVESTGLSQTNDKIIEIGIRTFKFNRTSGEIISIEGAYTEFEDPGQPLSEDIQILTGITDEMVKGKKIDWVAVNEILRPVHLIVAHNAAFDRPFVDRASPVSREKIWACSLKQIDWFKRGYSSPKLDLLNVYHGFFTDSHRALNDADALIYLLNFNDYFQELMTNARKPMVHMIASAAPFEAKDALKNRNYKWDVANKYWHKQIFKELQTTELEWLEQNVYAGAFRGKCVEILPQDNFKSNQRS